MEQFKIRASGAHAIMGVKTFGKTGETYCKAWLKEYLYKRRTDIKSKYIEKGNTSEEDAFTLLTLQLNLGMVYKNHQYFEDDFMCGTPDLIIGDVVYDNKCSWSLDTFPMFEGEIPNNDYELQLQVYMHLTGTHKAVLAYTLIDTPKELIEREIKWVTSPDYIYRKVMNMVYTKTYFDELKAEFFATSELNCFVEIPEDARIKTFDIAYNEEVIKKLQNRVTEARNYLNSLITNKN